MKIDSKGRFIKTGKIIECKTCSKKFYVRKSEILEGRKYCSRSCFYIGNSGLGKLGGKVINIKCPTCNKNIYDYFSNKRKFCSKLCFDKFQIGKVWYKNHPKGKQQWMNLSGLKKGQGWNKKPSKMLICPICEKRFSPHTYQLKWRITCSNECRIKRLAQISEANLPKIKSILKLRTSGAYRRWRKSVFERDDYTCQMCKITSEKMIADHIKSFTLFPSLRFDVDNGRTLCINCHKQTETFGANGEKLRNMYVGI